MAQIETFMGGRLPWEAAWILHFILAHWGQNADIIDDFLAVKPTSRPRVDGFKATYRVGDVLNMTCSLADTFPAANLTWFFSGDKVRKEGFSGCSSIGDHQKRRLH